MKDQRKLHGGSSCSYFAFYQHFNRSMPIRSEERAKFFFLYKDNMVDNDNTDWYMRVGTKYAFAHHKAGYIKKHKGAHE